MDRRNFLKIAMISSAGAGVLLKSNLSHARGISSKVFPGIAPDKCYAGPPKGVILTSVAFGSLEGIADGVDLGMAFPDLSTDDDAASTGAVFLALFGTLLAVGLVAFSCFVFAIRIEGAPKNGARILIGFPRGMQGEYPLNLKAFLGFVQRVASRTP